MRTEAEVRAFLDTLIGSIVINKPDRDYDGQCVTLIKALLEFLGVPNPYAARGNAKDVGDALIRQGIGVNGKGSKLTIVINKDMGLIDGIRYGHIWVDLTNLANYESNGSWALHVTKNTRPITQGQQFINLDQWIGEGKKMEVFTEAARQDINVILFGYDKGWFKGFIGGEYKTAIYAIKDSPEYRAEQFVNKGDLTNYLGRVPTVEECNEFQITLGQGVDRALPGRGVTHKNAVYNLMKTGRFVVSNKTAELTKQLGEANATIATLRDQITELSKRPTAETVAKIQETLKQAEDRAAENAAKLKQYQDEDTANENAIMKWLKALFRLGGK